MQDPITSGSLIDKVTEEYELSVEKITTSKMHEVEQLPNWDRIDRSLQIKIQSVLRRINLANTIAEEDVKKWINVTNEAFEVSALQTYLLLTCLNMLGELNKVEPPLSFLAWLDTSNSSSIKSLRDEAITKSINSIGSIDDQAKAVKLIKSVFAQYRLNNSIESNFFYFFTDALDQETQNWISSNCWIYQDNPLEKWANLQNVKEGYSNLTSPENKRLTNARKRWDALDSYQKLYEVSQFLEALFNQYNVCMVNPPVKFEKDPISKVWKDIDIAVSEHRLNYLSNNLFNQLGGDGQKFRFNEVRCVYKDEELYILETDVKDRDRDNWLKKLQEWLKTKIDAGKAQGDTVFLFSRSQALVISEKKLPAILETWIDAAIKNVIARKQY
ncbi:MAG: hypothetical protein HZC46_12590 [Ignavibacterium album]|uniref:hypothetical protein n=1 Tax=Ignavibacterium album TaxID=591197 RepID=UPI0026F13FBD|nr:hypothetical protein [Ignavibacterium album]MBI5662972.1 hypothetical protein [Ignavibacterium album]